MVNIEQDPTHNPEYGIEAGGSNEARAEQHAELERHRETLLQELAVSRDTLSEDVDGIYRLQIPAYDYDTTRNPFYGVGPRSTKIYEVSRYIDVVFIHKYLLQDVIVCGIRSGEYVKKNARLQLAKHIRDTGDIPMFEARSRDYDVQGIEFTPYLPSSTIEPWLRYYHIELSKPPHYPFDIWMVYDAHVYEKIHENEHEFEAQFRLKKDCDRRSSLLGVALVN